VQGVILKTRLGCKQIVFSFSLQRKSEAAEVRSTVSLTMEN